MTERDCGKISVCLCCMLAHAADGCGECDHDREPWSLITPPHTVTMGLLAEEHRDGCDREEAGECDCEHEGFSWSSCEGCGSPLGGDRWAFTLWEPAE